MVTEERLRNTTPEVSLHINITITSAQCTSKVVLSMVFLRLIKGLCFRSTKTKTGGLCFHSTKTKTWGLCFRSTKTKTWGLRFRSTKTKTWGLRFRTTKTKTLR